MRKWTAMGLIFALFLLLTGCGAGIGNKNKSEETASTQNETANTGNKNRPEETALTQNEAANRSESETVLQIKIDYGSSRIYTKEDMNSAIAVIPREFSTWDGCELHSISYSSDDECSQSNIEWLNEMEAATDATETFTQCIMFTSNFHSPKQGGGAWNADEEYTDWQWWLARSDGGQWKLMTWGY